MLSLSHASSPLLKKLYLLQGTLLKESQAALDKPKFQVQTCLYLKLPEWLAFRDSWESFKC